MDYDNDSKNKGYFGEDEDTRVTVPFFEDRAQREQARRPKRRPGLKKKQIRSIFLAGVATGLILATIISLVIPDKKAEPVPEPVPPVTAPVVEPVEPEVVPGELMIGRNHSNAAEDYAYDIKEVKDWISGGKSDEKKTVFLTFDDGPGTFTREVLDVLKEKEVPATFFLLGEKSEKVSTTNDLWKRYIEEGHALAIHSYSHKYEVLYADRSPNMVNVLDEWEKTATVLKERVGEDFNTRIFRFPGGSMSWQGMTEAKAKLEENNIYDIDWTAISGDSEPASRKPTTVEESWALIQDNISRTAHPETMVLLMHDAKADTPKFLGELIDKLKGEGYEFGILY